MKKINAKNATKTLALLSQEKKDLSFDFNPVLTEKGTYRCECYLPLIEKLIVGIGEDKISSIDNLTKQTSKLIDDYLSTHPDYKLDNPFDGYEYEIEEDDFGFISLRMSQKENERQNELFEERVNRLSLFGEKVVDDFKYRFGKNYQPFIMIINREMIGENATEKEAMDYVSKWMIDKLPKHCVPFTCSLNDDLFIIVGASSKIVSAFDEATIDAKDA